MYKNIYSLTILLLCINTAYGQQTATTDSSLLALEQKVFITTNDTLKTALLVQKTFIRFGTNSINEALLNDINRLDYRLIQDSATQIMWLYNASLAYALMENYRYALIYYNEYASIHAADTSLSTQLLHALLLANMDNNKLNTLITNGKIDTRFTALNCYIKTIDFEKKGKNSYLFAQALLPGSGMALLGKPLKGLASLSLNGASVYAVYTLFSSHLYINAILWGATLGTKFYMGGVRLTETLFNQKQEKQRYALAQACQNNVKQLLTTYPLNFKLPPPLR